jgi:D-alanyl-D-alanine dipeptidase
MNGERMAVAGERETASGERSATRGGTSALSRSLYAATRSPRLALAVAVALLAACSVAIPANEYGLRVVPDLATYERLAARDSDKRLVEVTTADPAIRLDVRYATPDNILHRPLYPVVRVMLRAPAAKALAEVQHDLAQEGLGLKVFDGYRPYRVTKQLWVPLKNPDYVADPAKGSRHNRGAAVDLTLVDLKTGEELRMPTGFDDMSPRAAQAFAELPPNVIANRAKLREVMIRHGFDPLPSEWWHFDYRGWQRFELMDVPLEDLPRTTNH